MSETKKFDYYDKVIGYVDGFGMSHGEIVDIDPESDWPYMVRDVTGAYNVFTADELEVWDGA